MHTSISSRRWITVIAAAVVVLLACLLAAAALTHDDCTTQQRWQGVAYARPKPPAPRPKPPAAPLLHKPTQHVRKLPTHRPAHTADSHRFGKHTPVGKHHHHGRRRHHGSGLDVDDWPIVMCDDGWNVG